MKKLIFKILVLALSTVGIIFVPTFASDISEQIRNAKCITEYPSDTDFDDFETVIFGEYPQSNKNGNIERNDGAPEPIEWFVLEKQGDKALLLSKYIMGEIQKKGNYEVTSWNNSFLKNFLNNTFKNKAFNSNE